MKSLKQGRIGMTFRNNKGIDFHVSDYKNSNNVEIEFPCGGKLWTKWSHIISGEIRYPNNVTLHGEGSIGFGSYGSGTHQAAYRSWDRMLRRCYGKESQYSGVVVDSGWKNFQNYARWFYDQKYSQSRGMDGKSYHLDKDLLGTGSLYSENSCCFIPQKLNQHLQNTRHCLGYEKSGNKYYVRLSESKGFYSETEARDYYLSEKINIGLSILEQEKIEDERLTNAIIYYFSGRLS